MMIKTYNSYRNINPPNKFITDYTDLSPRKGGPYTYVIFSRKRDPYFMYTSNAFVSRLTLKCKCIFLLSRRTNPGSHDFAKLLRNRDS